MPHPPRICPHCGAPQEPGATRCRACDQPLSAPTDPLPAAADPPRVPAFRPPGAEAWPVMWALVALCALGYLAAILTGTRELSYALVMIGLTLLLTQLILWAGGMANARQGAAFLASDRPLVRWVYTPEEWQQVRAYFYEQTRVNNEIPVGIVPTIFGLIGLMVGLLIGTAAGQFGALIGAVFGVSVGVGVGGALILPINLLNRRYADQILQEQPSATVALGAHELFYKRIYFDGHRQSLRSVRLRRRPPPRLQIDCYASRYSPMHNFPTMILVPPRMLPAIAEALPRMEARSPQPDAEAHAEDAEDG